MTEIQNIMMVISRTGDDTGMVFTPTATDVITTARGVMATLAASVITPVARAARLNIAGVR